MSVKIHPTAIIDSNAEIDSSVEIGAYSIIGPDVRIATGSKIGPHVVIVGHTRLGANSNVFQFASLGAAPQDLKFKGEPSTLILGTNNTIREYVTLQPGTGSGTMTTTIGDNNLFMANSHVAHDCRVGDNNIFANSVALAGHVTIQNNVILGGMAGIHQFARVGSYVMVSAGSMVAQDVPPYCVIQGDRACLRGLNLIGLQRSGMSDEEIVAIKKAYRHLFSSVGRLKEKIETLPAEIAKQPKIKLLTDFIINSQRGICNPGKNQ